MRGPREVALPQRLRTARAHGPDCQLIEGGAYGARAHSASVALSFASL